MKGYVGHQEGARICGRFFVAGMRYSYGWGLAGRGVGRLLYSGGV